jgi:hypothetical protein
MLRGESSREPVVLNKKNLDANECLLVMLQPQLTLAKIRPWPLAGFICEGRHYRDVGLGEWTAFYDWFRDPDSNILGVRYWMDSETEFLADYAKDLPYIQIDPSRNLEIYFSERRTISQLHSGDQEFLYDAIFRSDDGQCAIGFGIGWLNDAEILSLQNTGARWAEAQRTT